MDMQEESYQKVSLPSKIQVVQSLNIDYKIHMPAAKG